METELGNGTNETVENPHVVESFGSFCFEQSGTTIFGKGNNNVWSECSQ